MSVIKFPCSICQKPMAVGPELAGCQVRCPHCLQVLVAPAAAAPAYAYPPAPPSASAAAPPRSANNVAPEGDAPAWPPPGMTDTAPSEKPAKRSLIKRIFNRH